MTKLRVNRFGSRFKRFSKEKGAATINAAAPFNFNLFLSLDSHFLTVDDVKA